MSSPASPPFALRLAAVGSVVFFANAGLLVLQLVAGRLLSPFVGSSLETWTAVIAAFLAGIALGNSFGGRVADRDPRGRKLSLYVALGALAALWMMALPMILRATEWHALLPIGPRIPVLAFVLCFPAGFVLSVLTPMAIRAGVPDVRRTGLVSGIVFGLSTLGCLLGNYLTGFVLIPELSINQIVLGTAILLFVLAAAVFGIARSAERGHGAASHPSIPLTPDAKPYLAMRSAFAVVFLCSFAGMTLELAATRLLAPIVGVSLYTWTGVIGVMLAGTCLGNWLGGLIANAATDGTRARVAATMMTAAGIFGVLVIVLLSFISHQGYFGRYGLVEQVLLWTFSLFFVPMLLLGTVSPQVIRLAIGDVHRAGNTAGRIYAWSTAGAIAGTFATGYVLISFLGVWQTILIAALLPTLAAMLVANPLKERLMLYAMSIVGGALFGAVIVLRGKDFGLVGDDGTSTIVAKAESNYYTIVVHRSSPDGVTAEIESESIAALVGVPAAVKKHRYRSLQLDLLTHSIVDLDDPTYLHYPHEQFQVEAVVAQKEQSPAEQRVLVIGGGGYTFPRCVRTTIPTCKVDVVEIDPAVTKAAYDHLGLERSLGIDAIHMDGRQFVVEKAKKGHYHVVTLDAVNDFSVPYHLLTKECNEAVKSVLTDDGLYLVTVIDDVSNGKLWKAAYHTLQESFPHVEMTFPKGAEYMGPNFRSVIVLYASNKPLIEVDWDAKIRRVAGRASKVRVVPREHVQGMLELEQKAIILTDQFSPVDNLMMQVFRNRQK